VPFQNPDAVDHQGEDRNVEGAHLRDERREARERWRSTHPAENCSRSTATRRAQAPKEHLQGLQRPKSACKDCSGTHTHTHTHTHTNAHKLSLSHTHTNTHTNTCPDGVGDSLILLSVSLGKGSTRAQTHTHTCTHTHTIHMHTCM